MVIAFMHGNKAILPMIPCDYLGSACYEIILGVTGVFNPNYLLFSHNSNKIGEGISAKMVQSIPYGMHIIYLVCNIRGK